MKYYVVDDDKAKPISDMVDRWNKCVDEAERIGRELGIPFKDIYYTYGFGCLEITGWLTDQDWSPEDNRVVKVNKKSGLWKPKDGNEISKRFNDLQVPVFDEIRSVVGCNLFGPDMEIFRAGVKTADGKVYLELPDWVGNPDNCTRISDVEYEKIPVGDNQ